MTLLSPNMTGTGYQAFTNITTNQTSSVFGSSGIPSVVQAIVTGTGTVTATLNVYGTILNSTSGGVLLGTITLNNSGQDQGGLAITACWPNLYIVVSNLTGTGATLNVYTIGAP